MTVMVCTFVCLIGLVKFCQGQRYSRRALNTTWELVRTRVLLLQDDIALKQSAQSCIWEDLVARHCHSRGPGRTYIEISDGEIAAVHTCNLYLWGGGP
jgi:hypothetical protein